MEAATLLHPTSVRVLGDRLVADGLVVDDLASVDLVRERTALGEDPAALLLDAIAIGARVLGREHAAADAEYVRVEFEKAARNVENAFAERARNVGEQLGSKFDEVFGADSGVLHRALERHFSDDSSGAVQHRVRAMVAELLVAQREDLVRQFSSADAGNPLAEFKRASVEAIDRAGRQQDTNLRGLHEKMAALERELQGLRDEREKRRELELERERGTAKGRAFEEEVASALDEIATSQGDDCEAIGDIREGTGKTGDVVVGIDACHGPARGRIVFEAKDSRLSRPQALAQLDRALAQRSADFAVLVVRRDEQAPARMRPLREYNGDKLVVAFDPEDATTRVALEVAYALARARVLMTRAAGEGIDAGAIGDAVGRTLAALEDARRIKQQLTGATTSIDQAKTILGALVDHVRAQLGEIDALLRTPGDGRDSQLALRPADPPVAPAGSPEAQSSG